MGSGSIATVVASLCLLRAFLAVASTFLRRQKNRVTMTAKQRSRMDVKDGHLWRRCTTTCTESGR